MVDVVANHMGSDATAETVDYSIMNPFNSSSYFHSVCFIDDSNNQTQIEHVGCCPRTSRFLADENAPSSVILGIMLIRCRT
jgi:hypothetical protein